MRFRPRWTLLLFGAAVVLSWALVKASGSRDSRNQARQSGAERSAIFSPGHRSLREAAADFFGWRPSAPQPIAFTHRTHLENSITCQACHAGVDRGPVAGLPSVKTCMFCHGPPRSVASDRPEIQKLAAYQHRGEDIPWQRIYGFSPSAHVKFNHAPHVRAGVDCAACHGDLAKQTVAVRAVDLDMGFCIACHKQNQVSIECVTCHF